MMPALRLPRTLGTRRRDYSPAAQEERARLLALAAAARDRAARERAAA